MRSTECIYVLNIFQILSFVLTVDYCAQKKFDKNKLRILSIALLLIILTDINAYLVINTYLCIITMHLIYILIIMFMSKESRVIGSITVSLLYTFIQLNNTILVNILMFIKYPYDASRNIIIIEGCLFNLGIFLCRDKIMCLVAYIKRKNYDVIVYVASVLADFIVLIGLYGNNTDISKYYAKILIMVLFLLSITFIFYFLKMQIHDYRITILNDELQRKNDELRKIKHDYGSQISCVYGLYLLKRYDDMGDAIKRIINDKDKIVGIETNIDKNSIVFATSLREAQEAKGVKVIVEDTLDYKNMDIPYIYLHRIISNIVSNAIRAMNGKGVIKASAYNFGDKCIIEIENNGPKIPDDLSKRIFEKGFTTKQLEANEHGYGLNIVKDLVHTYGGEITLDSNEERTIFKMVF